MGTILKFKNVPQAFLFEAEFSGQISDGRWENARPYDHWNWVCNVKSEIAEPEESLGYFGPIHRRKYNVKTWANLYQKEHYEWAYRIYDYYIFAMVSEMTIEEVNKYAEGLRMFVDYLISYKFSTFEDFKQSIPEWMQKYYKPEFDRFFTDEILVKMKYESITSKEMKKELNEIYETINNYLGYGTY